MPPTQPAPETGQAPKRRSRRRAEYDPSEALGRHPRRRFSAMQVLGATLLALFVGGCLNSGTLVNMADTTNEPDAGFFDERLYDLARANDRVANFFSINRFADAIGDSGPDVSVSDVLQQQTPTPAATSQAPEPTPTPVPLRTVSAGAPLQLYVAGDSVAKDLGEALSRVTPVDLVTPELDARVATGLTRPDAFDWPQRIAEIVTRADLPDAMVFMAGSNDWQDKYSIDDRGSPEWQQFYREQVAQIMDLGNQVGVHVFWVGMPPVRPDKIADDGIRLMNSIFAEEAAKREWVTYVDAYTMFSAPGGGYADFVNGTLVRQDDGIHLNFDGINMLGEAVYAQIRQTWTFAE